MFIERAYVHCNTNPYRRYINVPESPFYMSENLAS
jgi:hypothetical protein